MNEVKGILETMASLRKFEALLENDRKAILEYAARPLVETIKSGTPVGSVVHRRYTHKQKNAKRAAKGAGKVVSTYHPGNLRGSIEILTKLKRTDSVWVGPRGRRIKTGNSNKGDGYYALIVEQGSKNSSAQPFFYRSVAVAAPDVKRRLEFGFQVAANKFKPL